jgi:hypothetical protein
MRAVAAKRRKLETGICKSGIEKYLAKRPIPAVRGPEGQFYIIDGHHLGLALWQAAVSEAYVQVIDDLSRLSQEGFWNRMEAAGRLYLFDEEGRRIHPSQLPTRLHALRDDPYRDLARSAREEGGFRKAKAPYSEFCWAGFLRTKIASRLVKANYAAAVRQAIAVARTPEAANLPGFNRLDRTSFAPCSCAPTAAWGGAATP